MTFATDQDRSSLEAIIAVIARSPIVAARPDRLAGHFHIVGFEEVDIAVLRWIARECRRAGTFAVM
jgi:hypothetical protein